MKDRPIIVHDFEKALEDFLAGKPIQEKNQPRLESLPSFPKTWYLPSSIDYKIRAYIEVMDHFFNELRGNEIGFMNVFDDDNPTCLQDVILYHQLVRPGLVDYSDMSCYEVYKRTESLAQERSRPLALAGLTHVHPAGLTPSSDDLKTFERLTWHNLYYQNHFGYVEATDEFVHAFSQEEIQKALQNNDALVLSQDKSTKVFFKVNFGYSLFLIYTRDCEKPSFFVGEARKYCFDIGPKSFKLYKEPDGLELKIIDDANPVLSLDDVINEISTYVKPLVIPIPRRPDVIPFSVASMPEFYHRPEIVARLEDNLPMTADEFFCLVQDFLRFAKTSEDANAIGRIHELLSAVFRESKSYKDQFNRAQKILRSLSPEYDAAINLKQKAENDT